MLLHIFLRTFASVLRNITFFKNQLETIMLKRMRVIFTLMLVFAHGGVLICAQIYAGVIKPEEAFDALTPYGGIIRITL